MQTNVIGFQNDEVCRATTGNLQMLLEAIGHLEIVLSRVRSIISGCSDGPAKLFLTKEQDLLEEAVRFAKDRVRVIALSSQRRELS